MTPRNRISTTLNTAMAIPADRSVPRDQTVQQVVRSVSIEIFDRSVYKRIKQLLSKVSLPSAEIARATQ